ncbi:MAG: nucleotidyltransferase domain-containing protein [Cyanobacteria bacterium K_Offshore_surface_m2_239]|nr:nucleotidyltransferase domain-containing protein [Cyanobacteria bacterium K_Offshore_surface_m2_239]
MPPAAIAAIQQVLAGHPALEQAILYGSRALGRHRPASDIDLTLIGSGLSAISLSKIDSELDDLLLPWVIDLSRFSSQGSQSLHHGGMALDRRHEDGGIQQEGHGSSTRIRCGFGRGVVRNS